MYADKDKIEWLLFESGKSLYEIQKNQELPQQLLQILLIKGLL